VKGADLRIAVAAESQGATGLHYDQDFDVIADVTGQPTRWIAPRGSHG
jgi:predicted nucleic acid-binding protein